MRIKPILLLSHSMPRKWLKKRIADLAESQVIPSKRRCRGSIGFSPDITNANSTYSAHKCLYITWADDAKPALNNVMILLHLKILKAAAIVSSRRWFNIIDRQCAMSVMVVVGQLRPPWGGSRPTSLQFTLYTMCTVLISNCTLRNQIV